MKIALDLFLRHSSGLTSEVNRRDDLMELLSKLILVWEHHCHYVRCHAAVAVALHVGKTQLFMGS